MRGDTVQTFHSFEGGISNAISIFKRMKNKNKQFSSTRVTCNLFNWLIKSRLLEMKWVFKHQDLQMFDLKLNK